MEIVDFLRARYAEARKTEEGKRRIIPSPFDGHQTEFVFEDGEQRLLVDGHPYPIEKYQEIATEPGAEPSVLADIEAKRAVVDFADTYEGSFHASQFLPKMAAVYRDHPDFDPAWLDD